MALPDFYAQVPRLSLHDPLADFLGAAADGRIDYGYADAVRLAGHSCPTVAGAYWLTSRALRHLYGDALPERGGLRVDFRADRADGVTGVVAAVVGLLTGAADQGGFKGLGGRFVRRDRLRFNVAQPLDLRYTRLDTGRAVHAAVNAGAVPADPALPALMQRSLDDPTADELRRFGSLWQDRVRRLLLDHGDDPAVFVLRDAG